MSILSKVLHAPKRFVAVAAIVVASAATALTFAWGPERSTFTIEKPATYVTFNSITNNPNEGDERNFVRIKSVENTASNGWVDDITVKNNGEYWVRMYVHNNAAANYNLVAENVTAQFNLPKQTASRIQVDGYLSASNANPGKIWDQAVFHGKNNSTFSLDYVAGSAKYTTNARTAGLALPDTVVTTGALLGYESLDGNIPGCFQYSGILTFKVKAKTNSFDLNKTVRIAGGTDKSFQETVKANAGQKVDFQIYFKNSGGVMLNDVVIKDTLPAGLTYVSGSSYLHNSNGTKQISDGVTAGGVIIGNYGPGADAYVKFTAQVAEKTKLPTCGVNTLKNIAKATTQYGDKSDDATVTVTKECVEKTIEVCRLSDKKYPVTIKESEFDSSKHSKNPEDCKTKSEQVRVCDVETSKIIIVNKSDASKYAPVDSPKCQKNPATPVKIPSTGPAALISSLTGISAITYGAYTYAASRRALKGIK